MTPATAIDAAAALPETTDRPAVVAAPASTRVDVWVNGRVADSAAAPERLAADLAGRLAAGQVVTLIPLDAELTVEHAADLLLASPPFVLGLIGRGELPATAAGAGRRVRYADVMAYKRRSDEAAREGMAELTRLSQELGLYD